MSRDWMADWADNPIFVKHARSRLRRQPLLSALVITLVLCLCVLWGGFQLDAFKTGGVFGILLALQTVILGIMGAGQVGGSVSGARASGIMDFHRVSPLTPTELVLGFFFGAPVREYLLFLVTLPFSILCVVLGTPDFRGFVQVMILLVAGSWVMHALALINGLVTKGPAGSRGVVGLLIFLGILGGNLFTAFGNIANRLDAEPRLDFFGISLPWLAVVLLYLGPLLFFLYLASKRRIDSERVHPFSKPQAVAAMATLGALLLGGIWSLPDAPALLIAILYVLVLVGILLAAAVTPNQAEYYKGLWRAHKLGLSRLSLWHDLAGNRAFLAALCGLVLATATVAWGRLDEGVLRTGPGGVVRQALPLAIATGVVIVAYHGLALQFFLLRFGRRGWNYLSLFLFLVWVLPLVAGTIMALADNRGPGLAQAVFAVSPIAGLGLTAGAGVGGPGDQDLLIVAGAALTPSLLFAFVFNGLVTYAQRRIRKAVLLAIEKTKAQPEALA
jgi:hypothetical protein